MSTFPDIAEGYRRLQRGDANYGLIYTCNAGWVDLGHMNPFNSDPLVGAHNLWRQFQAGGPDAQISFWYDYPPEFRRAGYSKDVLQAMKSDKVARLPDGGRGFKITLKMAQPVTGGVTESFLVRHELPDQEKRSVALAVFLMVSRAFEQHQFDWEFSLVDWLSQQLRGKPYDSGFSQEDLVSNLIGFYIGVGHVTKDQAIRMCHPVSRETAEKVWQVHGAVGKNKNRSFEPDLSARTGFIDNVNKVCRDDCIGQPRQFPRAFQQIVPAPYAKDFVLLRT
jgi:hypothetical protein